MRALLRLEVAHQVPAQPRRVQVGQGGHLRLRLLHAVLAEVAQPRREGLADAFGRVRLAHGHQRDLRGLAAGAGGRPGDALPDGSHAFGDHFFGFSACSKPWAVATFWALVGLMERYFSRWAIASGILFCPTATVPMWK